MRKYDVAISVAVEDKDVAKAIVAELDKLKVKYYYYEMHAGDTWGHDLIKITMDAYGNTRYTLLITSEIFVTKYWSGIEKQVALAKLQRGYVLQLRLDNTRVDGISEHVVYQDWKDNPAEIAQLLYQKVRKRGKKVRDKVLQLLAVLSVMMIIAVIWVFVASYKPPFEHRVLVPSPDVAFYIGNAEVTVADYKKYCMSQGKPFPAQPPRSCEDGPVRNVTWEEAKEYCEAQGGRLPGELEWEYAALANESTVYSGGTAATTVAVYNRVKPATIGSRKGNAWGIYDMSGNVAEWCADWADSTKTTKVVKGGGYLSTVDQLTVSYKRAEEPTARLIDVGFRVVWDKH
jgi:formylglycine-generating enzyme